MVALPLGSITSEEPWTNHLPAKRPAPGVVRAAGDVVLAPGVTEVPAGEAPRPSSYDVAAQPAGPSTAAAATATSTGTVRVHLRASRDNCQPPQPPTWRDGP